LIKKYLSLLDGTRYDVSEVWRGWSIVYSWKENTAAIAA